MARMISWMPTRAFCALLLLLLAAALGAQPLRESITVEVVNVPVYVHRGEQPVEGLTRESFELLVNGKPQAIEYFDVIGAADPGAKADAAAVARTMRERRLFLLIFDIAFSRPFQIEKAREAALQLLAGAKPGDYFAVATFAPHKGIQVLVPFTPDTTAVTLAVKGTVAGIEDPLRIAVPRALRTSMMAQMAGVEAVPNPRDASERPSSADDEGTPRDGDGNPIPAPGMSKGQARERNRRMTLEEQRPIIEEQLSTLANLARRLSALEGQKHVVLLSEGFDMSALDDPRRQVGATKDLTAPYIAKLFEQMAEPFRSSGVFLHTLEVSGLAAGQARFAVGNDAGSPSLGVVRRQEGMNLLASHTGGEYLHDRNDLHAALADVTNTYRHGYLLGFRPANAKDGYNSISVRLKGQRGAKVTHRFGFETTTPVVNRADALHLADIILNDVPQNGVPAQLAMREGRLIALIPRDQLAAVLGGQWGRAELMVYVFDASGSALDFRRAVIDVPAGANDVYPVSVVLGLPPGPYTIKALLRAGDSLGLSRVKLNVTAPVVQAQ